MTYSIHHPALHDGISHEGYPAVPGDVGHFVPEGWEDLDRGICPCGEVVVWNEAKDRWDVDRSMKVLVLTGNELSRIDEIVAGAEADTKERAALCDLFEKQADLNEPYEDDYSQPVRQMGDDR